MCPNRSERVKEVFLKAPLPLLAIHFRLYKFLIKLNPLNSLPLNMTLKELFPAAYTRHSGIKLLNLKTKKKKSSTFGSTSYFSFMQNMKRNTKSDNVYKYITMIHIHICIHEYMNTNIVVDKSDM